MSMRRPVTTRGMATPSFAVMPGVKRNISRRRCTVVDAADDLGGLHAPPVRVERHPEIRQVAATCSAPARGARAPGRGESSGFRPVPGVGRRPGDVVVGSSASTSRRAPARTPRSPCRPHRRSRGRRPAAPRSVSASSQTGTPTRERPLISPRSIADLLAQKRAAGPVRDRPCSCTARSAMARPTRHPAPMRLNWRGGAPAPP